MPVNGEDNTEDGDTNDHERSGYLDYFSKAFQSGYTDVRERAAFYLGELIGALPLSQVKSAWPQIEMGLSDPEQSVKENALGALHQMVLRLKDKPAHTAFMDKIVFPAIWNETWAQWDNSPELVKDAQKLMAAYWDPASAQALAGLCMAGHVANFQKS